MNFIYLFETKYWITIMYINLVWSIFWVILVSIYLFLEISFLCQKHFNTNTPPYCLYIVSFLKLSFFWDVICNQLHISISNSYFTFPFQIIWDIIFFLRGVIHQLHIQMCILVLDAQFLSQLPLYIFCIVLSYSLLQFDT